MKCFKIFTWLIMVLLVNFIDGQKSDPVVTVKQGLLRGAVKRLLDGATYYSFQGIPYAKTPVGELRFTAPLPPETWQGTYEAIKHGPACPQFDVVSQTKIEGNESCLFLNVYTRTLKPSSKTPVMVFIHGGAYMSGSGDDSTFGPEFLLQHDVILVTFNYRLEVLGFLCLDTPEVPGNAGMKDQVAALRWVNSNIAQFGGDPDNVTLFGESAGSSAVTFHMQSPMSKGLFHKAIAQSGVSIDDWAPATDGKRRAFRLGKILGKDTSDPVELLKFLRSVPVLELTNATVETMTEDEKNRGLPVHFAPVVEKEFNNVEHFLNEQPIHELLAKNTHNIPLMLGYMSIEGLIMLAAELKKINFTNENLNYLVPREIAQRVSENKTEEIGKTIKKFYFGNKEIAENDTVAIINMLSDIHFVYNIHRFAYFYSATDLTYLYKFSFDTDMNVVKIFSQFPNVKGASHADDLFYLFYNNFSRTPYEKDQRSKDAVYRVTKIWTDFAKTGNPIPKDNSRKKWLPYCQMTRNYMDINEPLTPGQNAERERIEFWDKLYCDSGVPCMTSLGTH